MNSLKHLLNQPTDAVLTTGTHTLTLINISFPDVADDKTPYALLKLMQTNKATTTKRMFEKELELMVYHGKAYYNIENTNATLQTVIDLMKKDTFPVTVTEVTYKALDGTEKSAKNWYFFTENVSKITKEDTINEK